MGWNKGVPCRIRNGRRIIARKPTADAGSTGRATAKDTKRRVAKPDASLAEAAKAPGTPRKKASVAGPKDAAGTVRTRRKAVRTALEPSVLENYLGLITESIDADKGEDIVVLDLSRRSSFADRMVIATGIADRQISAMATHIETRLNEAGLKRIRIEGAGGSDWVLIDAGDIVVHLFKPEARALYALERMWGAELDEPASTGDAL